MTNKENKIVLRMPCKNIGSIEMINKAVQSFEQIINKKCSPDYIVTVLKLPSFPVLARSSSISIHTYTIFHYNPSVRITA